MEINGKTYQIGQMAAMKQYHVMRRILPAAMTIPSLLTALDKFREKPEAGGLIESALPLADALAAMSDQDSEFVINACLQACRRVENGGRGAPVMTDKGVLMFADLTVAGIVALTVETLKENLGSFFPEITALLSGPAPDQP